MLLGIRYEERHGFNYVSQHLCSLSRSHYWNQFFVLQVRTHYATLGSVEHRLSFWRTMRHNRTPGQPKSVAHWIRRISKQNSAFKSPIWVESSICNPFSSGEIQSLELKMTRLKSFAEVKPRHESNLAMSFFCVGLFSAFLFFESGPTTFFSLVMYEKTHMWKRSRKWDGWRSNTFSLSPNFPDDVTHTSHFPRKYLDNRCKGEKQFNTWNCHCLWRYHLPSAWLSLLLLLEITCKGK